ncbi:MAG: GtrA family protein [Gammaproteobacteria bacterium]|nr:GtrA family protein [Gammaproteobacteria bacterium]
MKILRQLLSVYLTKQFIYFILSGTTAVFLHWLARIILRQFFGFQTAAILAYFIGITIAFILYRFFVFPLSTSPIKNQSIRFLIINFSFAPFVLYAFKLITIFLYQYGQEIYVEETAHIISLGITPLITFLCYKFFAFKE